MDLGHILTDPKPKNESEDKMGTNKLRMSFLAHSQMNSLMSTIYIKLQKKFGML